MNQRPLLTGQTMLILGGAGNMGLATAQLAALEGAKVILVGRRKESLVAAVETVSMSMEGSRWARGRGSPPSERRPPLRLPRWSR